MDKFQYARDTLDRELGRFPWANNFEKSTGVPKGYAALGVLGVLIVMIFFNIAGQLTTNLVGFAYPAYASFKSIKSATKSDDVQWLTYWVVFSFFNVIEFFTDILLYWLPFYYVFKTAFLLWLYLPFTRGADRVYTTVICPFFESQERTIDSALNKAKRAGETVSSEFKKE